MFRYLTSYRFYISAKLGFGVAYLWYVADFFRIHGAEPHGLDLLLPDPHDAVLSGSPALDTYLRPVAQAVSSRGAVDAWTVFAPVAVGLFLWGRHRWLQVAVAAWIVGSMVALNCLVGIFSSTVDVWLNLTFFSYGVAALVSSARDWEAQEGPGAIRRWRENPALASRFAWLVVWLQFLVYLFAGINKLVLGWGPWTTGVALQNLAIDSSIHDFARGVHVSRWLALILCYITLLQRLVVPFGFYFRRGRLWSVLILGTMHLGYALLMNVNLFPLIGLASLLVILPPAQAVAPPPAPDPAAPLATWFRSGLLAAFALLLGLESTRLVFYRPLPWENALMLTPSWRMFADGGVAAGGEWRIVLASRRERIDATELARARLPHLWRDRFYINNIFNDLINHHGGPGSLVDRLARATRRLYREQEQAAGQPPQMTSIGFELYQWSPPAAKTFP